MSGAHSRNKGANFERKIAMLMRMSGVWPLAERELDQVRGFENGRDLIRTEPFCVQCKAHKAVAPGLIKSAMLEAAKSRDRRYRLPVVVWKSDRKPITATMMIDDFLWFFSEDRDRHCSVGPAGRDFVHLDFHVFLKLMGDTLGGE
jgi:hypothetical protein